MTQASSTARSKEQVARRWMLSAGWLGLGSSLLLGSTFFALPAWAGWPPAAHEPTRLVSNPAVSNPAVTNPGVSNASQTSLLSAFAKASDEFGVPAPLLQAVSYQVTAWNNARGIDAHSAREFGVMGLRAHALGPSLEAASGLLGVPLETLRDDQVQNIRGGAALLASYARQAQHGKQVSAELTLETAQAWWDAIGQYSGVTDARHQDLFAAHVFETLDQGAEGVADSGEKIRLEPQVLPSLLGDWIADARRQAQKQSAAMSPSVDYSGADWVAACSSNYSNYSRTATDIAYVIVHKIEGSYSGCISWFQNCSAQVSAHYVISKNGDITQMVKEEDVAWHAGNWNYNLASVGLEHEGYTAKDDVTDAEYKASAALTKDICDRNGIPKSRTYIIGHNEVPGATHTDPGAYWDWTYYMQLVGGTGGGGTTPPSTGNLVGFVREDDIYSGAALAGASVTLSSGQSTTTDASGYYAFTGLAAGTYTVTASLNCYDNSSVAKAVTAGVDNWASIALTKGTSCGGDGGEADGTGSCRFMGPGEGFTRIHTANTSPLTSLPINTVGFAVACLGSVVLFRRRRR